MKKIIYIILIFIANASIYSQIMVETNEKKIYKGVIIFDSKDSLAIFTFENEIIPLKKDNLKMIKAYNSTIILKSGEELEGYIDKMDKDSLSIVIEDLEYEIIKVIQRKDIKHFKQKRSKKDKYFLMGLTYSSLNLINIIYGYESNNVGIRTALYFFDKNVNIFQFNIYYNIFNTKIFDSGISLFGILSYSNSFNVVCLGTALHMNLNGIFLEGGLIFSDPISKKPSYLYHIGYVKKFN